MLKPYALRLPTATAVLNDQASYVPVRMCECSLRSDPHHTVLCGTLYTACVDASGTVYLGPFRGLMNPGRGAAKGPFEKY